MQGNGLTFETVTDAFLYAVPELRERYKQEFKWWAEGPEPHGQYIFFALLAVPAVRELLDLNYESILLQRIFDFFEEMARSSDIEVVNLLQIAIFEWLVADKHGLATAWKYMGEETKAIARETARIWRREDNLPQDR